MIPALEVVKRAGTKIIYMCFLEEENEALKAVSDEMITYSRQDVLNSYKPHKEETEEVHGS
jgi:hypothetical protein